MKDKKKRGNKRTTGTMLQSATRGSFAFFFLLPTPRADQVLDERVYVLRWMLQFFSYTERSERWKMTGKNSVSNGVKKTLMAGVIGSFGSFTTARSNGTPIQIVLAILSRLMEYKMTSWCPLFCVWLAQIVLTCYAAFYNQQSQAVKLSQRSWTHWPNILHPSPLLSLKDSGFTSETKKRVSLSPCLLHHYGN